MLQDQRWGLTPKACAWVLDLYNLKHPETGNSFLLEFVWHMVTLTDGWQRTTWIEVASWLSMPEIRVGLIMEIELWTKYAEPEFAYNRRHFQGQDGLPGHGILDMARRQHEVGRVFWTNMQRDWTTQMPLTYRAAMEITDVTKRENKLEQLKRAFDSATGEYFKLYDCIYQDWMLYTWLNHPKYAASAARALAHVMNLDRCRQPQQDDEQDMMFKKRFTECRYVVLQHARSWGLLENAAVLDEIRAMTEHEKVRGDTCMHVTFFSFMQNDDDMCPMSCRMMMTWQSITDLKACFSMC